MARINSRLFLENKLKFPKQVYTIRIIVLLGNKQASFNYITRQVTESNKEERNSSKM